MKHLEMWCVTGINKLTEQREIVSSPCSRANAEMLKAKAARIPARKRTYLRPRVDRIENYPPISRKLW